MSDARDIVLTGIPRGGTTLACRLLSDCAETVALFEPIDIPSLPTEPCSAARAIERFFAEARAQLLQAGTAPSKVVEGKVPDNPFLAADTATGERRLQAQIGLLRLPAPPSPGFTLAIKHNAAFTALLPLLHERFPVIAIVRNPLAALASWHSVPLPVGTGRLPAGERFDAALASALASESDPVARQLHVLDWLFARYATLPPERVLRYEDIIASAGGALFALAGVAAPEPLPALASRNTTPACPPHLLPELARRLLAHPGAWRRWYQDEAISGLLDAIRSAP